MTPPDDWRKGIEKGVSVFMYAFAGSLIALLIVMGIAAIIVALKAIF